MDKQGTAMNGERRSPVSVLPLACSFNAQTVNVFGNVLDCLFLSTSMSGEYYAVDTVVPNCAFVALGAQNALGISSVKHHVHASRTFASQGPRIFIAYFHSTWP